MLLKTVVAEGGEFRRCPGPKCALEIIMLNVFAVLFTVFEFVCVFIFKGGHFCNATVD